MCPVTDPSSVTAELARHLERFAGATYVFPSRNGGPLHAADWQTTFWRPAIEAAGLPLLRPHHLKHTGVAFLAAAGVDPSEIARRAGQFGGLHLWPLWAPVPEIDKQAAQKLELVRAEALPNRCGRGSVGAGNERLDRAHAAANPEGPAVRRQ